MSTIVERINIYAKYKGTTKAAIERESGLSNATFKPTTQLLRIDAQSKIAKAFPDLNIGWLLTGTGPMLKDNDGGTPAENKSINPQKTQSMDQLELAMDYIRTLKQQIAEKDNLIRAFIAGQQAADEGVLSRRLGAVKEKQDELTNKP